MKKLLILLVSISFILISCTQDRKARKISSDNVEEYLKEAAVKTWESLPERTKKDLTKIRTNLTKYLLHATYKSEEEKLKILAQARRYLEVDAAKLDANIIAEQRGERSKFIIETPPSWTLAEEVKWLNQKIKRSEAKVTPKDFEPIYQVLSIVEIDETYFPEAFKTFGREDMIDVVRMVKGSDNDQTMLNAMGLFEEKIDAHIKKFRNLGTELKATNQLSLQNEEAEKFVVKFLDFYYGNIDIDSIKNIINDAIALGREPTRSEMIGIMFKNSGPGFGKTLQQLGKEQGVGSSLSEIMEILENDGKQVPYHLVKKLIDEDKGGFKIKKISKHALGTGTMAQVNKAVLVNNGVEKTIAVRFLKPEISKRTESDIKILREFIEEMARQGELSEDFLPTARKLIESIASFLKSELDIPAAIEKQLVGKQVYEKSLEIKIDGKKIEVQFDVPDVFVPAIGKETNLHLQEFIPFGKKFSSLENGFQQKVIAQAITELWFNESLIKSGFMHSDLHQGNFSVLRFGQDKAVVTIYDFGMSETLSRQARKAFILIGAGTEFENAKLIVEGIETMDGNMSKSARKKLIKEIERNFGEIASTEEWIVWAMRKGHLKSDQIGTLARGSSLVTQLGKQAGESDMAKDVVEGLLGKSAAKRMVSFNSNLPLTRKDVYKIGSAFLTDSCINVFRSFKRD